MILQEGMGGMVKLKGPTTWMSSAQLMSFTSAVGEKINKFMFILLNTTNSSSSFSSFYSSLRQRQSPHFHHHRNPHHHYSPYSSHHHLTSLQQFWKYRRPSCPCPFQHFGAEERLLFSNNSDDLTVSSSSSTPSFCKELSSISIPISSSSSSVPSSLRASHCVAFYLCFSQSFSRSSSSTICRMGLPSSSAHFFFVFSSPSPSSFHLFTPVRSMQSAGASRFKWTIEKPYVRRLPSDYFHYPAISRITGKRLNWMYDVPKSGYEAVSIFGPNTLELKNIPMGKTPEYMQERLRRFFSKFGFLSGCRCVPHSLDPYQCEGTAYVTFRSKYAALKALNAPLKFPPSLHDKIVRMRHLDTDKENDWQYIEKAKHWNAQLLSIARQLYIKLSSENLKTDKKGNIEDGVSLDFVWKGLFERQFDGGAFRTADLSVYMRFGSWEKFLAFPPFTEMFEVSKEDTEKTLKKNQKEEEKEEEKSVLERQKEEENEMKKKREEEEDMKCIPYELRPFLLISTGSVVRRRLLSEKNLERLMKKASIALSIKLADELSVHWRKDKIALPAYVQRQIRLWDHKDKLSEELQMLSRTKDVYKIHDERFLFKLRLKRQRNKSKREFREQRKLARLSEASKDAGEVKNKRNSIGGRSEKLIA